MASNPTISLRETGEVPYFNNIEAALDSPDLEFEQDNVRKVFASI